MNRQKLLIVDDIPENIRLLGKELKSEYQIAVSPDGERALKIAKSGTPPDLILLDIMMPDVDGYEVCRRLKRDPKTKDIPVVLISAVSGVENETKGFESGAVDYIRKPFDIQVVKARIRTHLKLRQRTMRLKNEIRDHARTSEELQKMRGYFENVFDSATEAISIWDDRNSCVKWNKMSAMLFGFDLEDIDGRHFSSLFFDEDDYVKMQAILLEKGVVRGYETNMRKKDGNIFPCEISLTTLKNGAKKRIGSVFTGRDLTELKFVQTEHVMLNELLKSEIDKRIKAENELNRAKKHLEEVLKIRQKP